MLEHDRDRDISVSAGPVSSSRSPEAEPAQGPEASSHVGDPSSDPTSDTSARGSSDPAPSPFIRLPVGSPLWGTGLAPCDLPPTNGCHMILELALTVMFLQKMMRIMVKRMMEFTAGILYFNWLTLDSYYTDGGAASDFVQQVKI